MDHISFVENLLAENSVHPEWETLLDQDYVDNLPSLNPENDQNSSELSLGEVNIDNLPLTLRYMDDVDDLDLLPATTIASPIISTLRDPITETADTLRYMGNCVKSCDDERKNVCSMMTIGNEICSKSFDSSSALKRHEIIHTEKKSYLCKICDKKFKWKCSLVYHERIHTGKKIQRKHVCGMMTIQNEICGKSFDSPSALKKHEIIHGEKNIYVCNSCKKSFSQLFSLLKHRKNKHQIESTVRY